MHFFFDSLGPNLSTPSHREDEKRKKKRTQKLENFFGKTQNGETEELAKYSIRALKRERRASQQEAGGGIEDKVFPFPV